MLKQRTYSVNEIFYSIQGEGNRTGTVNVFVRFSGCNLTCNIKEHGFDCDTNWSNGIKYTENELIETIKSLDENKCGNIIWTGGEPALQLSETLLASLPDYFHAVETNGTRELPDSVDWISCSPKTAEHTLRCGPVNELRYVINDNMALPKPRLEAEHFYLSPTFNPDGSPDLKAVKWCQALIMENPKWKLSLQTHKLLLPMR